MLNIFAQHPRGLMVLFGTEMWERASYYGMRAILVLALTAAATEGGGLDLSDTTATAIYGMYTGAVYLACLPGGWIADRLLGQRNAVWYGGLIIAGGHFTMALPFEATFYVGLILIALGTGLLKPNVSTMVGDLYPQGSASRDAAFSIFYMGINVGAFFGQLVVGYLGEKVGWHWGFGAAGVGMLFGLWQYRVGAKHLGQAGLLPASTGDPAKDARVQQIGWRAIRAFLVLLSIATATAIVGWWTPDAGQMALWFAQFVIALAIGFFAWVLIFGGLSAQERKHVGVIAIFFVASAVFWSGFDQAGSSLNIFADRYTDRMILGWEMPASWLQSINPMLIILLAPFFAWLWVHLAQRNMDPSSPIKFAIGLLQLGLGFWVMVFAARIAAGGELAAPTWLLLTYLFHTTGELCLSPVGLSAVTKLAPRRYLGQMMGTWFMASSLGNVIAGLMAGHITVAGAEAMPEQFMRVVYMSLAAALLMFIATPLIKSWMKGSAEFPESAAPHGKPAGSRATEVEPS
nr:peptide MFS transporter [Oceanococcus sp. HetDA_MAG_MS8]